ncbi:MAG: histidinol-phosphate aminotransferase family protein [Deltaproteobacteria bacterium]|nr:histidinol-phosphate aminotransferase family protein [Deltaproteobacteria bacterium]
MDREPMMGREHGGPRPGELEDLGFDATDVWDFSVNINPYGPCPAVVDAIAAAPVHRYPDGDARAARGALAQLWNVPAAEVTIGNGAAELLWLLARTLARAGDAVVIAGPTFSEMATAARAFGAQVVEVTARAENDFALDERLLSETILRLDARVVYLCVPNNPTGTAVSVDRLAALAGQHPQVTFVIDQAFLSLSDLHATLGARRPANAVLVRSLTKDHAIPGLRLGAVIADPAVIQQLNSARPSWNTGTLVQAAAVAVALPVAQAFVAASRARMLSDRRKLEETFRARGYTTYPTCTTFFLVEVGDAAGLRGRLLREQRILVRDCTSFGLPTLVRIGAQPAAAQAALMKAWDLTVGSRTPPVP